jgi:hypothetical protein
MVLACHEPVEMKLPNPIGAIGKPLGGVAALEEKVAHVAAKTYVPEERQIRIEEGKASVLEVEDVAIVLSPESYRAGQGLGPSGYRGVEYIRTDEVSSRLDEFLVLGQERVGQVDGKAEAIDARGYTVPLPSEERARIVIIDEEEELHRGDGPHVLEYGEILEVCPWRDP